jgi:hypothetical protein
MSHNNQGMKWIRPTTRAAIYARDGHACVYCGRGAETGVVLGLDHVQAREMGGTNLPANLVTACVGCNAAKGVMSVSEFISSLPVARASGLAARIRRLTARVLDRNEGRRLVALRRGATVATVATLRVAS